MTVLEAAIPVLPVRDVPKAVAFEVGPYAGVKRDPIGGP